VYSSSHAVYTYEDYERMMRLEDMLIDFLMPVYR
jgi:hypothetical protein